MELFTRILAKIDLVEGSILELIESTLPSKAFLNAELIISAFKPGFKTPTYFSGILISIIIFLRSSRVTIKLFEPRTP